MKLYVAPSFFLFFFFASNSDGLPLLAMASNLLAMASNLIARQEVSCALWSSRP